MQLRECVISIFILFYGLIPTCYTAKIFCEDLTAKSKSSPELSLKDLQFNHGKANRRTIYSDYGNRSYMGSHDGAKRIAKRKTVQNSLSYLYFSHQFPFSFLFFNSFPNYNLNFKLIKTCVLIPLK